MKYLQTLSLLIVLCLSTTVQAQDNYGFYGKKFFLEASSSSYFPIIYNVTTDPGQKRVVKNSTALTETKDWIHSGARVSFGYSFSSKVGVGIEFGFDKFHLNNQLVRSYQNPYYESAELYIDKHERIEVNAIQIMPRIEISGPNGLLPNGLVHQIGVGVVINKAVDKDYVVKVNTNHYSWSYVPPGYQGPEMRDLVDFTESYKMLRLEYGLKMRTPVAKFLMINYGFRYNLDIGTSKYGINTNTRNLYREIRKYQFRNVIAFDLGLTVPF